MLMSWASDRKLVLPATCVERKRDDTWKGRAKSVIYSGSKRQGASPQLRSQGWWGLQKATQWGDFTIG